MQTVRLLDIVLPLAILIYNLGQHITNKFRKLFRKDFAMEYFTADFLQFSRAKVKCCILSGWLEVGGEGVKRFASHYLLVTSY